MNMFIEKLTQVLFVSLSTLYIFFLITLPLQFAFGSSMSASDYPMLLSIGIGVILSIILGFISINPKSSLPILARVILFILFTAPFMYYLIYEL